ncbi:MAG: arginine--tRNA ligase, partial [Flavobacteriales bacterium]|nr:arginine--tRNA ligase [Flavobacteriales bacterium]
MELEKIIQDTASEGLKKLFEAAIAGDKIILQKTRKDFEGDITILTFPFTSLSKKSPEETGELLGQYMEANCDLVDEFNVVKGFLNLSISDDYWVSFLGNLTKLDAYGLAEEASGKTVMVEYSQPNTNKPLHLGHLRNNMLGFSLANILKANGHKVIMANIINDRGIHICKSMLAWQKWGDGETPESSGLKGDKVVGKYYVKFDQEFKKQIGERIGQGIDGEEAEKKAPIIIEAQEMLQRWEAGDKDIRELWETMNKWVIDGFEVTYENLGVTFDEVYYESDTYILGKDHVAKGLEDGTFYQKEDKSIWCDLSHDNMDPKLLLRGDGTSVYITQDIGTAIKRFEDYKLNQQIYVVGNEQLHHFKVLFSILKKMGYEWADSNYHLSYGMVELPDGKMKSREGTIVDADDIMDEMVQTAKELSEELGKLGEIEEKEKEYLYNLIGLGALKYFLLKVDPKKKMMFDPRESIDFAGNTGPFIQYTYTRIRSLLRKADAHLNLTYGDEYKLDPKERQLIKQLHDYPGIIKAAGEEMSPALLANYVYELAKGFNNFYQSLSILKDVEPEITSFRLNLSNKTGEV